MNNSINEASLRGLCDEMLKLSLLDEKQSVSNDNVFSVFEVINKEVPYCRVLQYLINEYWPSFEKNVLGGTCNGEKLQNIEREFFCGAPCDKYDKEGRIDILLETAGHVVAIEVKVGAGDQENQLMRYSKALNDTYSRKAKHIYYLTVDGHESETCVCNKECAVKCRTEVVNISFDKHICDWLKDICLGEFPNMIATHFLEVLELNKDNTKQTEQYLKVLSQSKEYPFVVQKLYSALPNLWERIRDDFLNKLTDELCNTYGFLQIESNLTRKNEIWAKILRKGNRDLCLCYETNFFVRTGEQNKEWAYISKEAFYGLKDDLTSYWSQKECDAFNLKTFTDSKNSNKELVEWYCDRESFPSAIQCIAESANRFFEENN